MERRLSKHPAGLLKRLRVMMERTVRTQDETAHAAVPLELGGSVTLSVAKSAAKLKNCS